MPEPLPVERLSSLPRLFAATASRFPQREAVAAGAERWTYADLANQVAVVAGALGAAGIASGDLVGVLQERSPRAIAWILGVLAVGATYVPLDPGYPRERL